MLNRCCCMRLNTFGVVVGWLGIIGSFVALIVSAIGLIMAKDFAKMIAQSMNPEDKNVDIDALTNLVVIGFSIYLGYCLIGLLSSALLVVGTVKERHLLLLPWLINSGIGFVFNIIYQLALIGALISKGGPVGDVAPPIVALVLVIAFQFYIIYAVYSLYKQIQATRDLQTPLVRPPVTSAKYPSYTKI